MNSMLLRDVRRLRYELLLTLAMLVGLSALDAYRYDYTLGPAESLLNFLLPAAWAYLVGSLILQDPPEGVGQRAIKQPFERGRLLAAKGLFVIAFVHLPSLAADSVILAAHGFPPWQHLGSLLWKQAVLAAVLVVPSAAVASVCRSLQQFLSAVLVLCVVGALVSTLDVVPKVPWIRPDSGRLTVAALLLFFGAMAVLGMSFGRRWIAAGRVTGMAVAAAAFAFFAFAPWRLTGAMDCSAESKIPPPAIRLGAERPPMFANAQDPAATYAIPLDVADISDGTGFNFDQLALTVSAKSGFRWSGEDSPPLRPKAWIPRASKGIAWQMFSVSKNVVPAFDHEDVQVEGVAAARLFKRSQPARIQMNAAASIAGVGRCGSSLAANSPYGALLKVLCESPETIPLMTGVRLTSESGGKWAHRLGDSDNATSYPRGEWLSPLNRRQTFFHVVDDQPTHQGSGWLVPRDALTRATLEISAEIATGCAVTSYVISDLRLSDYRVPTRGK